MTPAIDLINIHKHYANFHALNSISLSIAAGEMVAITGESGSGTSTLMHIIGLLGQPCSGEYWLNGKNVRGLSHNAISTLRNQTIGFVFQQFFLLPKLSATENVALPLIYRGLTKQEIQLACDAALDQVGMRPQSQQRPSELSGGQKQRVAIARALVGNPSIILADEPTGALDSKTSHQVIELIQSLNHHNNTTTIIVTHDSQVAHACQRQIQIHDGHIT